MMNPDFCHPRPLFNTFLAILLALGFIATSRGEDRFPWLEDLGQARAEAASSGKPMLIVFRCEP
jgi:hypothetical protein